MKIKDIKDFLYGYIRIVCEDKTIFETNHYIGIDYTLMDREIESISSVCESNSNPSSDDFYGVIVVEVK